MGKTNACWLFFLKFFIQIFFCETALETARSLKLLGLWVGANRVVVKFVMLA